MTVNRVTIVGNLTRDAELRQTAGGTSVAQMGVAVNNRRKNQQTGEWEDEPCYVDCVMFGQRAQSIAQYLSKGTRVAIDGKLRYSSWEKDGQKRSKLEVVVDDLDFMGSRQGDGGHQDGGYRQQQPRSGSGYRPQREDMASAVYDEDIPF